MTSIQLPALAWRTGVVVGMGGGGVRQMEEGGEELAPSCLCRDLSGIWPGSRSKYTGEMASIKQKEDMSQA